MVRKCEVAVPALLKLMCWFGERLIHEYYPRSLNEQGEPAKDCRGGYSYFKEERPWQLVLTQT